MTDTYDPVRNRELAMDDYGYTPTVDEVREGFANGDSEQRIMPGEDKFWMIAARRRVEFDRWLDDHDAEVTDAAIKSMTEYVWDLDRIIRNQAARLEDAHTPATDPDVTALVARQLLADIDESAKLGKFETPGEVIEFIRAISNQSGADRGTDTRHK